MAWNTNQLHKSEVGTTEWNNAISTLEGLFLVLAQFVMLLLAVAPIVYRRFHYRYMLLDGSCNFKETYV